MARAMKCDICKEYYEVYGIDGTRMDNTLAIGNAKYGESSMFIKRRYDCCIECMKKVNNFIITLGSDDFEKDENGNDISNPENLPESLSDLDYYEKENEDGKN